VLHVILMHSAIYLDREFRSVAIEIDDVSLDDLLTPEVKTVRRIAAQSDPEPSLRNRHFTAELLGEKELLRMNPLTAYDVSVPVRGNLTP
jgi:hypothetical protein